MTNPDLCAGTRFPDVPVSAWGTITERQLIERVPADLLASAEAKAKGKPYSEPLRYVVGRVAR